MIQKPNPTKLWVVTIILVFCAICTACAQQTPVKVLIKMDKRSQYGFK